MLYVNWLVSSLFINVETANDPLWVSSGRFYLIFKTSCADV